MTRSRTTANAATGPARGDCVDVNAVVSYNLRAIRRRRHLTQQQVAAGLARLTGHLLTKASISQMERGLDDTRRRRFDAHQLYLLSVVLDVAIAYFFLPPPAANGATLAHTRRPLRDLVVAPLGREHQLADMDDRLAALGDPQMVTLTAAPVGTASRAAGTCRASYRRWRQQRLAGIARVAGVIEIAAQVLGACSDRLHQIGLGSFEVATERTTPLASSEPHHQILAFHPPAPGREPLDPADPAPDQVSVDLSDWVDPWLDGVFTELLGSAIDHAWDGDHLVFHTGDGPEVTEVLERLRDADWPEVIEILDRSVDSDEKEEDP